MTNNNNNIQTRTDIGFACFVYNGDDGRNKNAVYKKWEVFSVKLLYHNTSVTTLSGRSNII